MAPKTKGKTSRSSAKGTTSGLRTKAISGNVKAGTIFPVGRCNTLIRQGRYSDRVGKSAGAFMAAVLEYITAEMLELAGNVCDEGGKKRITPKHINLGVRHDEELAKLMTLTTISQGGMVSNIHESLLPAKKGKKAMQESQAM